MTTAFMITKEKRREGGREKREKRWNATAALFFFFSFCCGEKRSSESDGEKKNSDPPPFTHNSISLSLCLSRRTLFFQSRIQIAEAPTPLYYLSRSHTPCG
jgi:hypothetical protein